MTPDERFRHAVEIVLKHEGGYVNDPRDPGGETKYGISKHSSPPGRRHRHLPPELVGPVRVRST